MQTSPVSAACVAWAEPFRWVLNPQVEAPVGACHNDLTRPANLCRADRGAVVRAGIGKASFEPAALEANALALTRAVLALRPKGVKGGAATGYIVRANLSSTMGPGFLVSTQALVQAAQTTR